eukprot:1140771-Pelagomonas_calceolata.AAC.12
MLGMAKKPVAWALTLHQRVNTGGSGSAEGVPGSVPWVGVWMLDGGLGLQGTLIYGFNHALKIANFADRNF